MMFSSLSLRKKLQRERENKHDMMCDRFELRDYLLFTVGYDDDGS